MLLEVSVADGAPTVQLHYRRSVLSDWYARQIASTIGQATEEVLSNSNRSVKELNLFSRQNLEDVTQWTFRPAGDFEPSQKMLVELFANQVQTQPDAAAIDAHDGKLTYKELSAVTDRLAVYLQGQGVQPEDMVALCCDRSCWAVVAMLGILKAGAAFVPIDPTQPMERLLSIVEGTGTKMVLASPSHMSTAEKLGIQAVPVSKEAMEDLPELGDDTFTPINGRYVYVLHTSGSTGKPKGVLVENTATSYAVSYAPTWHLTNNSRILQFAGYSFAMSVVEIFSALSVGAALCIISDHDRFNNLEGAIIKYGVNWTMLTPSASTSIDASAVSVCLRHMLLAGEAMNRQHIEKWSDKLNLIQALGMTESCGSFATVSDLVKPGMDRRVIGNSTLLNTWLTDPTDPHRLAPVGTVAELLIEGPCIARGYLKNPEKTAESFLENPPWMKQFRTGGNARLYRTGDMVQYTPDGLVYVGRKDGQVKVRGKRVELGEVEYHVSRHWPKAEKVVASAAVPGQSDGTAMLVVFIKSPDYVARGEGDLDGYLGVSTEEFRSQVSEYSTKISESLPDYMVPDAYLPLGVLPVTRTGKTEHNILRKIVGSLTRREIDSYNFSAVEVVAPQTEMERRVHGMYCKILQLEGHQFGIHDRFIRLGGDSVKAMKLVNTARKEDLSMTVEDILGGQTIAEIAHKMEHQQHADEGYGSSASSQTFEPVKSFERDQAASLQYLAENGFSKEKVAGIYPCSPMQEGILMSQAQDAEYYEIRTLWEVTGEAVSVEGLQRSWQQLVERHPLLRTAFLFNMTPDTFAVQATLKAGKEATVEHAEVDRDGLMDTPVKKFQERQPTDWLPQVTIYSTPSNRVFAFLQLSHALCDALSLSILTRDWKQLYNGQALSPVESDYQEYVSYVDSLPTDSARQFWQTYLEGFQPCLFPQLTSNSSVRSHQAVKLEVPDDLAAKYYRFCEDNGITIVTLFKLAWSLVLHLYTGAEDISFGYASSGRDAPVNDIDDIFGPFVNALTFRMKFGADMTLQNALQAVQSDLYRVFPHQRFSMAEIRKAIGQVDAMFNTCMTFPVEAGDDGSLDLAFQQADRKDPTEYDILLEISASGKQTVNALLKYWTNILSEEQAQRLASTMQQALTTIAEQSTQTVGAVQLLSGEDRRMLAEWNSPEARALEQCTHVMIQEACQKRLDHPAVVSVDGSFSYSELDAESQRLACHIRTVAPQVGRNTFVPLCFSKCKWTPLALLAVLKTGAAFLLIDPSQPANRLQEICEELEAPLVLASPDQKDLAQQLVPGGGVIVVGDEQRSSWQNAEAELPTNSPSDINYAVYTSGSTGKPRGVIIEHRSFCTSAVAAIKAFSIFPESRVLQFSSHAFDASILDILTALIAGATLCIPSEEDRRDRLAAAMDEYQITSATLTPSVARILTPDQVPTLKSLALAGEAMSQNDIDTWAGRVHLINGFGPAECSIMVTAQPGIKPGEEALIGHSVGSSVPWVVDPADHEKLLPIGVTGEMVVEGPTVARGYLQRPDHTAAYFVKPPRWLSGFRSELPKHIYKTGDLVQYTDGGDLRYMGRKDTQVKIRGQRIELGEIEHNFQRELPGENSVTVEAVKSTKENRNVYLAAFVYFPGDHDTGSEAQAIFDEPNAAFSKDIAAAQATVDKILPSYMMPAVYIPLLRIPLSPSGKTNRKLLREMAAALPREEVEKYGAPAEAKRAPSTEMEKTLQRYFAVVLNMPIEDVGADDHFFRRGGDSLTAMKLVGLARQDKHNLSVKDIFNNPQLSALASVVRAGEVIPEELPIPFSLLKSAGRARENIVEVAANQCQVPPAMIEDIYPCTPLQEGFMALTVPDPKAFVADLSFSIPHSIDLQRLQAAWNAVANANPILRTRIILSDIYGMVQVVVRESTQWIVSANADARDFSVGLGKPLVQFAVRPRSDKQSQGELLMMLHHTIYDGWTLPLLLSEVEAAYNGTELSPRPFSPFIRYLQSIEGHARFWKSAFANLKAPVFPSLPSKTYQPSPKAITEIGITTSPPVAKQFTQNTFLRLAWAITQAQYQGTSDVFYGSVVSGRNAPVAGIESLTAPTIATVPCRVTFDLNVPVMSALQKVQEDSITAVPYEQTGLQNISRCGPDAALACSFQSLLVIQQGDSPSSFSLLKPTKSATNYSAFATFAMTMLCAFEEDTLKITAIFDSAVTKEDETQRLLVHFARVLRRIQENPEVRVKDILMVPDGVRPSSGHAVGSRDFWKSELDNVGATTFPQLPSASYKPTPTASFAHHLDLQRSSQSGFSTENLIQAAWGLLQARYIDSPETVLGLAIRGRGTVPFKIDAQQDNGTQEYLRSIHDRSVDMIPHQGYGLQSIASLGDGPAAACNFQTLLAISPEFTPLADRQPNTNPVALTLEITFDVNSIVTHAHFDEKVLSRDQVTRLVLQFEHVLSQLNEEPSNVLSDIDLVSPKDRLDILEWNKSIPDLVEDTVHHLIKKQVEANPAGPAICSWDGEMTYARLDEITSAVAAYLIDVGVGPEVFVPLCFEKSLWTIVAMLSVMKAGGAFVPLDAAAPASRLRTVVGEVGATIAIFSKEQYAKHPDLTPTRILLDDDLVASLANQPAKLSLTVTPANAAYVIFTSGSTGTPKGTVIDHRAYCTGALSHKEGLQMKDRVLQFASYAFDASLVEILSTLVQGGCVCVPSEEERRGNIAEAINRMKVNWMVLTPSFVSTIDPATVPTVEGLCLAGEAMSQANMEAWAPRVHLVNGYGPSECCVASSANRHVTVGSNPANIGTAVGGACWVVDADNDQKLSPIGAVGELLVEGHTLSRYYLNQPEKTAATFIPRPAWLPFDRCDRLYKTGDLVQTLPDGSMLFVGRKDAQVKIRGQRVELGEIEHHVMAAADSEVALSVVSYPKAGVFARKLTAILELAHNDTSNPTIMAPVSDDRLQALAFDVTAVSERVAKELPTHMVPDVWIVVEKLPSSSSTKIDRKTVDAWLTKLPSDFQPAGGSGGAQDMPELPPLRQDEAVAIAVSNKIAALVSRGDDSLRTALEGREYTIAATGLDSVQVISLVSFIKQNYQANVTVGKILDGKTTVRSLAALITGEDIGGDDSGILDVNKEKSMLLRSIFNESVSGSLPGKVVFVTGVTGFLGTQILRQVAERPDVSKVIAHVRASSPQDAEARCKDAAVRARWWNESSAKKIEAWAGDLGKPRLGLTPEHWAELTSSVNAIIHAGAAVNWNAGYEVLRAANVDSTIELVRASLKSSLQPRLVYVTGGHAWHPDETDESIAEQISGSNGYSQSKGIAELIIKHFAATTGNNGQFSVVKPGLIIGTPEEGVANTDDYLWRLAAAAVDVGSYTPDFPDAFVRATSSARVAEETINNAFCPASEARRVVYMTDGVTEGEFWDVIVNSLQYPLTAKSHSNWMTEMREAIASKSTEHPLWPVKETFEKIQGHLGGEPVNDAQLEHRKPHVKAAIRKNVEFLVEVGFMASAKGTKASYVADKVFARTGNVWGTLGGGIKQLFAKA